MITPIKSINISDLLKRENDLLVSVDDIKAIAINERAKQIDVCSRCTWRLEKQKLITETIEKYRKEMQDIIEGNEKFTEWQKREILECNELVAEELKGQKNEINRCR